MSRTLRCVAAGVVVAAFVATGGYATGQDVSVRWEFVEGTELVYRTTTSTETELPGGQGMATTETVMMATWSVLEVAANGDATVRVTTDRVQMEIDGPTGTMSIDSDGDQESANPQLRIATAQAGTSYTFVFGSDGLMKDIQGIEEMVARMRDALPPESVAMFDQMAGQTFTAETMKGAFQQGVGSLPGEPVGPGDTWDFTYSISLPMIGGLTTRTTSTLDRIEDRDSRVAVISTTGDMQTTGEAQGQFAGMMQMDDIAMIGTTEFDLDRGLLLKSTVSTTMEMTMAMGGREMLMGSITTAVVELVDG